MTALAIGLGCYALVLMIALCGSMAFIESQRRSFCKDLDAEGAKLREARAELGSYKSALSPSGFRVEVAGRYYPIYKPVAIVVADGCMTVTGWRILEGDYVHRVEAMQPINMVCGDQFNLTLPVIIPDHVS